MKSAILIIEGKITETKYVSGKILFINLDYLTVYLFPVT